MHARTRARAHAHVDQAVGTADGDGGLGARRRQRVQACARATAEHLRVGAAAPRGEVSAPQRSRENARHRHLSGALDGFCLVCGAGALVLSTAVRRVHRHTAARSRRLDPRVRALPRATHHADDRARICGVRARGLLRRASGRTPPFAALGATPPRARGAPRRRARRHRADPGNPTRCAPRGGHGCGVSAMPMRTVRVAYRSPYVRAYLDRQRHSAKFARANGVCRVCRGARRPPGRSTTRPPVAPPPVCNNSGMRTRARDLAPLPIVPKQSRTPGRQTGSPARDQQAHHYHTCTPSTTHPPPAGQTPPRADLG